MAVDRRIDKNKRTTLTTAGSFIAGALFGGYFAGIGKNLGSDSYNILKNMKAGVPGDVPHPKWSGMLFGDDPRATAVLPPGTNRHRLAEGTFDPSRYVKTAFRVATATHKRMLGVTAEQHFDHNSSQLEVAGRRNLLILGGPVSTELTRELCGYRDSPAKNEKKDVPIAISNWSLPYYFYLGDENGYGYWEGEKRVGRRWLENDEEKSLAIYGVMDGPTGKPIPPPMEGDRVAGDMLMITRVPNPNDIRGSIVIVGGLHGYSLEHFFSDLEGSLRTLQEVLNPQRYDFFQAMIPYSIRRDRTVEPNWTGTGDWRPRLSKVEEAAFLSHFVKKTG